MNRFSRQQHKAPAPNTSSVTLHRSLAVLAIAILPSALVAQSASVRARVDADSIPGFYLRNAPSPAGCEQRNSGVAAAAASSACIPSTGMSGSASGSYRDGVLRASAQLSARNATLTGAGTANAQFMAVSRVDYADRVTFTAPSDVRLTSYRFLVDWSGTLSEPPSTGNGVSTFTQSGLYFFGSDGPATPFGWTGITRTFSGLPANNLIVQEGTGRFTGSAVRTLDGNGRLTSTIAGTSSFEGLLLSNQVNIGFTQVAEVQWKNSATQARDGITQEIGVDFSRSARITGLQLFDGTRDVTNLVSVRFASGLQLTTVPEPATSSLLLLGAGVLLGGRRLARRRRGTA